MKKINWDKYDFEKLPELNSQQLKTFKKVSKQKHNKLKNITVRPVGRPKVNHLAKENQISIRFSQDLLAKLKAQAKKKGYKSYQKYIKEILKEEVS